MINELREIREALDAMLDSFNEGNSSLSEHRVIGKAREAKSKLDTIISQWESEDLVNKMAWKIALADLRNEKDNAVAAFALASRKEHYLGLAKAAIKSLTGDNGEVG